MHVVLVEPEIPPNTGNVARLCAATGITLHLVGRLGFHLTDSRLRRAGLDYWEYVDVRRHRDLESFLAPIPDCNLFFFSAHATVSYTRANYGPDSYLVFGSETRGLADEVKRRYSHRLWTIPMFEAGVRSLNLSNCVAIICYEALRQLGRV